MNGKYLLERKLNYQQLSQVIKVKKLIKYKIFSKSQHVKVRKESLSTVDIPSQQIQCGQLWGLIQVYSGIETSD